MKNQKNSLKNKVVLITGGSGGLGSCLCKELLNYDASIIFCYKKGANMKQIKNIINNPRVTQLKCDLSNINSVIKMINKIKNKKIDIFINNAGVYSSKPLTAIKFDQFLTNYNINFISPFKLMIEIAKKMSNKTGGLIINISSGSGVHGGLMPSYDYSLSKNNFIFLTKIMSKDDSVNNIGLISFVIRFMRTEMLFKYMNIYKKQNSQNFIKIDDIKNPEYFAKKIINYVKLNISLKDKKIVYLK